MQRVEAEHTHITQMLPHTPCTTHCTPKRETPGCSLPLDHHAHETARIGARGVCGQGGQQAQCRLRNSLHSEQCSVIAADSWPVAPLDHAAAGTPDEHTQSTRSIVRGDA